jgi:deoxyribonuclease-2
MGCIYSFQKIKFKVALKLPNGNTYKNYKENKFVLENNINDWIKGLFKNKKWLNWIVYNDQIENMGLTHTSKAHSKGILVWNATKIGFLSHSVPNFPTTFNGNIISDISDSELKFAQNFCFIKFDYTQDVICNLMKQITNTSPNIYMFNSNIKIPEKEKNEDLSILELSENISHISKSPNNEVDIYENISNSKDVKLNVQSWIRGQEIPETDKIKHIKNFKLNKEETYKTTQNHSKYAVSFDCDSNLNIFCDLNRMESQIKRGGCAICIKDYNLWKALSDEMILN